MKYFVTGGAGFIGSNLCIHLLEEQPKAEVTVYDNFANGKVEFLAGQSNNRRLKIIHGDLLDFDLLTDSIRGHDEVIHLAANADIAASAQHTDLDLKQTVLATYNVLESMRRSLIKSLVYSSGSGVYGDVGAIPTPEHFGPLMPVSMYGATKLGAEALISAFVHLFGMRARIFRFANVIGPMQTHGVGYDFVRKLRRDPASLEVLGDGMQSKSYIHVSDVIDAIAHVSTRDQNSVSIYNVSSGDYITVKRIAEIVIEEMGLRDVRVNFGCTTYGWKGDVPIVRLDDSKIRALGWLPRYGSEEAMRRSIRENLPRL